MKNSKRILGVALALIMIFNVFAIGTFAAFPEDTAVKLGLKTDKASYLQGEEITITFTVQAIDEVGNIYQGGQYEIGYNSAVLVPYSTSTALIDHGYTELIGGTNSGISVVQFESACLGNGSWLDETAAATYGWDTMINYSIGDDGSAEANPADGIDVFSIKMKIADDAADGTYTIGFNPAGYEGYNAYVSDVTNMGLYGTSASDMGFSVPNMYEYGTVTFKVGAEKVYHVQNQYRPNGDAYDIGVKFGFKTSDIDISFDGKGTAENVTAVGADIYVNGVKVDKEFTSRFVYDVNGDNSEYQYRVIIEGLAKDDATAYTIKPYVVYNGEPVYGEEVTVSAAAIVPQA